MFFSMMKGLRSWMQKTTSLKNRQAFQGLLKKNQSLFSQEEFYLLHKVLQLSQTQAVDIMVPRAEIHGIQKKQNVKLLCKKLSDFPFQRLPVYGKTLDHIEGYLNLQHLISYVQAPEEFDLKNTMEPAAFVAPSMRILDLWASMAEKKQSMVIVVDEHGATDGLITQWDLIHHFMGDIASTQNLQQPMITKEEAGCYMVDAHATVKDLEAHINPLVALNVQASAHRTVDSFIRSLVQRVPMRQELIRHNSGISFEIKDVNSCRIKKVCVWLPKQKKQKQTKQS